MASPWKANLSISQIGIEIGGKGASEEIWLKKGNLWGIACNLREEGINQLEGYLIYLLWIEIILLAVVHLQKGIHLMLPILMRWW